MNEIASVNDLWCFLCMLISLALVLCCTSTKANHVQVQDHNN